MSLTLAPKGWPIGQWLSPASPWSVGIDLNRGVTSASGVWPAANRAYFVPFYLPQTLTVARLFSCNGNTASGNVDVGVYRADTTTTATLVASAGSTAQAGTQTNQFYNVTDFVLAPGYYYFACAKNDTTGTIRSIAPTSIMTAQTIGCASMETAFPLPSTATLVLLASAYVPIVGFSTRSGL